MLVLLHRCSSYRIWGEMYVGGYHKSLTDHPTSSMFVRAGGNEIQKKKVSSDAKAIETFAEVAKHLSAISPSSSSSTSSGSSVTSPAKSIESRSKCYKQLTDLKGLKAAGILTQEEYEAEKVAIMANLKKL